MVGMAAATTTEDHRLFLPLVKGAYPPAYQGRLADNATVYYLVMPADTVFHSTATGFCDRKTDDSTYTASQRIDEALDLVSFIISGIESYTPPDQNKVGVTVDNRGTVRPRMFADITVVPTAAALDAVDAKAAELADQSGDDMDDDDDSGDSKNGNLNENKRQARRCNYNMLTGKPRKPERLQRAAIVLRLIIHNPHDERLEDDDLRDLPAHAPNDPVPDGMEDMRQSLTREQKQACIERAKRRRKRNPLYRLEWAMDDEGKVEMFGKVPQHEKKWYMINFSRESWLKFATRQSRMREWDYDNARKEQLISPNCRVRPQDIFSFDCARGILQACKAHPDFLKYDNWYGTQLPRDGAFTVNVTPSTLHPQQLAQYLFPDIDRPYIDMESETWKTAFNDIFNRLKAQRVQEGDDANDTEEEKKARDAELMLEAEELTRVELESMSGAAQEFNLSTERALKQKNEKDIRDSEKRALSQFKPIKITDYPNRQEYVAAQEEQLTQARLAMSLARAAAIKRGVNDLQIYLNMDKSLSDSELACRKYLEQRRAKHKHLSMKFVRKMNNTTLFGEFISSFIVYLENLDSNYATHGHCLILLLAYLAVFFPDKMKPHVVIAGPPKCGKTWDYEWVMRVLIPGTIHMTQGQSTLASFAAGAAKKGHKACYIDDDAGPTKFGIVQHSSRESNAANAQASTDIAARKRSTMTNPETAVWERSVFNKNTNQFELQRVNEFASKIYFDAANIDLNQIPENMLSRYLSIVMRPVVRDDITLSQRALGAKRTEASNTLKNEWEERLKRIQAIAWKVGLAVGAGLIKFDNQATVYFTEQVMSRAAKAGVPGTSDIREHMRIDQLIRSCALIQLQLEVLDVFYDERPDLCAILFEKDFDDAKFIEVIAPLCRTKIEHAVLVLSAMIPTFEHPVAWATVDAIKRTFKTPYTEAARRRAAQRKNQAKESYDADSMDGMDTSYDGEEKKEKKKKTGGDVEDGLDSVEMDEMYEEYQDAEVEKKRRSDDLLNQEAHRRSRQVPVSSQRQQQQQQPLFAMHVDPKSSAANGGSLSSGNADTWVNPGKPKKIVEKGMIALDTLYEDGKSFEVVVNDAHVSEGRKCWLRAKKIADAIQANFESPRPDNNEVIRFIMSLTTLQTAAGGHSNALRFDDNIPVISSTILSNTRRHPMLNYIYQTLLLKTVEPGRYITALPTRHCNWVMRTLCNDPKQMNTAEKKLYELAMKQIHAEVLTPTGRLQYTCPNYSDEAMWELLRNDVTDGQANRFGAERLFGGVGGAEQKRSMAPSDASELLDIQRLVGERDTVPVMNIDGPIEDLFNINHLTHTLKMTGAVLNETIYKSPTKLLRLKPSRYHKETAEAAKKLKYEYPQMFQSRHLLQFRAKHEARADEDADTYSMKKIRRRDADQAGISFLMDWDDKQYVMDDLPDARPRPRDPSPSPPPPPGRRNRNRESKESDNPPPPPQEQQYQDMEDDRSSGTPLQSTDRMNINGGSGQESKRQINKKQNLGLHGLGPVVQHHREVKETKVEAAAAAPNIEEISFLDKEMTTSSVSSSSRKRKELSSLSLIPSEDGMGEEKEKKKQTTANRTLTSADINSNNNSNAGAVFDFFNFGDDEAAIMPTDADIGKLMDESKREYAAESGNKRRKLNGDSKQKEIKVKIEKKEPEVKKKAAATAAVTKHRRPVDPEEPNEADTEDDEADDESDPQDFMDDDDGDAPAVAMSDDKKKKGKKSSAREREAALGKEIADAVRNGKSLLESTEYLVEDLDEDEFVGQLHSIRDEDIEGEVLELHELGEGTESEDPDSSDAEGFETKPAALRRELKEAQEILDEEALQAELAAAAAEAELAAAEEAAAAADDMTGQTIGDSDDDTPQDNGQEDDMDE